MNRVLPFFLLLVFMFSWVSTHAQDTGQAIVLDGQHKFSAGDDAFWASPDYDDFRWQTIAIPGSWQSQGIRPPNGIGWYRIHLLMPESGRYSHPAILLGRIGDADEVFFNGVKIGGDGSIYENFIEATKVERLYRIPIDLIMPNRDNIIAIRVMNTYLNGGLFDPGIVIDEYSNVLAIELSREKYVAVMESCFFTFFAMFFMTCLFFYIKGLRDNEYLFFWLFITLYGIIFTLGSVTYYNTGLKTAFVQQLINALAALLPASLLLLLLHIYKKEIALHIKIILMVFLLIALANFALPGYSLRIYLYQFWSICFVLTAAFIVFLAIKEYLNKYYESGPVLVGIIGLIAGWLLESIGGLDLLQVTGFFLWDYSVGFFLVCVMYALTARYTRIKKELQQASLAIFSAHEDERKRLARELHDGIGPSLLAIKLELQLISSTSEEKNDEYKNIVHEISNVIKDIRNISMDLRPSFLENVNIVEAITWHAANIQEKLLVKINIDGDQTIELNSKIKDNLYRIYQEALINAIKYSGATMIDIILKLKGNFLYLEINDNGKGFDLAQAEKKKEGIGLFTIRERVELLGGVCRIKSEKKHGTSIYIKVPVK